MWQVFENPTWKKYKEIAAVRGLLQWVGCWGWLVAIGSAILVFLWARFEALSPPIRFIAAAVALIVVGVIFALSQYLFRGEPATVDTPSSIYDSRGRPIQLVPTRSTTKRRLMPRMVASLVVIMLFLLAFYTNALDKLSASLRPPPETAVFMECNWASLPISPPLGGIAHILLLNRRRIDGLKGQNWGFFEVLQPWPNEAQMKKARDVHDIGGDVCYRCRVTNHGSQNLIFLAVQFDLWLGRRVGARGKTSYTPVITALDRGAEFDFYVVNDCNEPAAAIWEETALAQVLGESRPRAIPLRRTYRSPVDQVLTLFPTTVSWSGGACYN